MLMKTYRLLATGCYVAAFAIAAAVPALVQAQTKLRFQSTFPPNTLFTASGNMFAERVKLLSNGRLIIEMLPNGSVVPATEALDAVSKRVIDGAHSAPNYWVGKTRAAALFGAAPGGPFGMDIIDYMGWLYDAGGLELYQELYQVQLKLNVYGIPMTSVANQAMGWFKRPVKNWDDLKGRKCRENGITAEVYGKSGMVTVNMGGGEVLPAGERGVIECGEFVGAAEDLKVGIHTIWKNFYPMALHEPATVVELLVNGDAWKSLSPDLQAIMQTAALETTIRGVLSRARLDAVALSEMKDKHGVTIQKTPNDILTKTLESGDALLKSESEKNPFFKKVLDSQRAYAAQVVPTRRMTNPPYSFAADYYWPDKN
jgi:TRAP-type mannitol/chloroaromatic compound transport system substrate-binding protein